MKQTLLFLLTMLLSAPAYAQDPFLDVLFVSQPGEEPAGLFSHSDHQRHLDANGDGTQDLVMTRTDDQGVLMEVLVLDVVTNETLFQMQDVQTTLNLTGQDVFRFYGFADPDGDGMQDAIFAGDREVVVGRVDMDISEWNFGFNEAGGLLSLEAIVDLNSDGSEELIINYIDEDLVRILGRDGNDRQAAR